MSLCIHEKIWRKLTINESVRSGMPVSLTQASITPWISAVMVEPEWKMTGQSLTVCKQKGATKVSTLFFHSISASTARHRG